MSSGLRDTLPHYKRNFPVYDCVIIGAGIVGLSTGLHLAKSNQRVLLLEQFPFPHTRGCSHGLSRITRTAYEDLFYAKLMPEAMAMWKDLERESGKQIFVPTPVLSLDQPPYHTHKRIVQNMKIVAPDSFEEIDGKELQKRYPMMKFSSNYKAVVDKTGGVLIASYAVRAVQEQYLKHGGDFRDSCQVTRICPGNRVVVETNRGNFSAKSVVVCAGTFTNQILQSTGLSLPITPVRVQVCYWKEKNPGEYSIDKGFTSFIDTIRTPDHVYAIPSLEYPGFCKFLYHFGKKCNPEERDKTENADLSMLSNYIKEHLPGLESDAPSIMEICTYASTPDEVFIVDRHPMHSNIIIGTGFSGSGFKTAPIIGKALGNLAMNKPDSIDIGAFSISRFNSVQSVHAKL